MAVSLGTTTLVAAEGVGAGCTSVEVEASATVVRGGRRNKAGVEAARRWQYATARDSATSGSDDATSSNISCLRLLAHFAAIMLSPSQDSRNRLWHIGDEGIDMGD